MTQNVLFVASEMTPFVKTGGLADVVGALPKSLRGRNLNIKVILPLYTAVDYMKYGLHLATTGNCVQMGNCSEFFSVHQSSHIPGIEVFFIEFNKYFSRSGIYDDPWSREAYGDNGYRYAFFCRAALQAAKDIGFKPDIIHVHDWQSALIPYYVKNDNDPFFWGTKTLLTLHNLPFQGRFGADLMAYAKIDQKDFHQNAFEDYGCINFLKGGIRFADKINTVSQNYAREILTPEFGAGLDFMLRERQQDLSGILNGIDTDIFNPQDDPAIIKQYSTNNVISGKAKNKIDLQKRFNLEIGQRPVFSMAVRLSEQKGIGMLAKSIEPILNTMQCQFVIMGQGEKWAQDYLAALPKKYPTQIAVEIGFDSEIERLMDAGSDFSLVPSIYEPCGLKQMKSQTYGALPIGRSTGGLEDTIFNYNEHYGVGTGFKFHDVTPQALYNTIGWANATYYDRPDHINKMRRMAMRLDYSWDKSSQEYQNLYRKIAGV